jgi:hypothetical protein
VTWLSTIVVAVVVALALPVSQLRTVTILKSCCCPDPANCHCPDQKPDTSTQPAMRACHNSEQSIVAPGMPAFHAQTIAVVAPPARIATALPHAVVAPHQAPPPNRPDAPS